MLPHARFCGQIAVVLLIALGVIGCNAAEPLAVPRAVQVVETTPLPPSESPDTSRTGEMPSAPVRPASSPVSSPSATQASTATPVPTVQPTLTVTSVPTVVPTVQPTLEPTPTPTPTPSALVQAGPTSQSTSTPASPTFTATSVPILATPPAAGAKRTIAIDPGHGGPETGAVHTTAGKVDLVEKNVNLTIAQRLAALLETEGYRAVLIRQSDRAVNDPARDLNGDGQINGDDDLQARVDVANAAGADLLLSIHNNGDASPSTRGTSTWYCAGRPFGEQNRRLAGLVQAAFLRQLRAAGYAEVVDMGAHDDPPLQKPFGHLFMVGPETPRVARPSAMPGVVGESLFVTSDREAKLLSDAAVLQRLAQGYLDAVVAFFSGN